MKTIAALALALLSACSIYSGDDEAGPDASEPTQCETDCAEADDGEACIEQCTACFSACTFTGEAACDACCYEFSGNAWPTCE